MDTNDDLAESEHIESHLELEQIKDKGLRFLAEGNHFVDDMAKRGARLDRWDGTREWDDWKDQNVNPHSLGAMEDSCGKCDSLNFYAERVGSGNTFHFNVCCDNGKTCLLPPFSGHDELSRPNDPSIDRRY